MCMTFKCIDCDTTIQGREDELCFFDTDRCLECATKVYGKCHSCGAFIDADQTYCDPCMDKGCLPFELEAAWDAYKESHK
jgi:hypothetical protein